MFLHCPPMFTSQMLETTSPPSDFRSMDYFLAPSTPEALAHNHLTYVAHDNSASSAPQISFISEKTSSAGIQSTHPWTKLFSPAVPLIRHSTVISAAQISFCYPETGVSLRVFCELFLQLDCVSWIDTLPRRRYSYDAIHNAIAKSRSTLERGGYSRVSGLLSDSFRHLSHKLPAGM
jgi:hypothetical protein